MTWRCLEHGVWHFDGLRRGYRLTISPSNHGRFYAVLTLHWVAQHQRAATTLDEAKAWAEAIARDYTP